MLDVIVLVHLYIIMLEILPWPIWWYRLLKIPVFICFVLRYADIEVINFI